MLSVPETARLLELKPSQIYYRLTMCQIDGAVKVFSSWRLDEQTVRKMYERINAKRAQFLPGFAELVGFDAILEDIRKTSLQADKKSCFARLEGGRGMVCNKSRSHRLARQRDRVEQRELF